MQESRMNGFSIESLSRVISLAKSEGYNFVTMSEYLDVSNREGKYFIVRLDLDLKPQTLKPFTEISKKLNVPFTVFVRVAGPYNILWYPNYEVVEEARRAGCEIGLHTTPVEWATLMGHPVEDVFAAELATLRSKFPVDGVAPHRDINYVYNSLPWLEENWDTLQSKFALKYQAYQPVFQDDVVYVNEGLAPHLCWRNSTPTQAIETGKTIHMLLHPHWWYVNHPFEVG